LAFGILGEILEVGETVEDEALNVDNIVYLLRDVLELLLEGPQLGLQTAELLRRDAAVMVACFRGQAFNGSTPLPRVGRVSFPLSLLSMDL